MLPLMSTEKPHNDDKQSLRLFEEKNKETRPITPPSRRILGQKPPETFVVLPPDKDVVHSNISVVSEKNEPKNVSSEDQQPNNSETINSELENLNNAAPLELTAEFLSCVMNENYGRSLELCKEILSIDPENKTCLEFKDVIVEKLNQEEEVQGDGEKDENGDSNDDDSDDDESDDDESDDDESDDDDDDESDEVSDDDESDDDDGSDDDSDDEHTSSDDSDSDNQLSLKNLNLLMGGLPLRNVHTTTDENKH